jgi:hypothetical protein
MAALAQQGKDSLAAMDLAMTRQLTAAAAVEAQVRLVNPQQQDEMAATAFNRALMALQPIVLAAAAAQVTVQQATEHWVMAAWAAAVTPGQAPQHQPAMAL